MQGRRAISTFSYTDNLAAERHYRRAIDRDPDYARPYAELAAAMAIRFENGWDVLTRADEEKAFYFARKAAELDPDLWLAQYVLGRLYLVGPSQDIDASVLHLEQAMSLQPENDDARAFFAVTKIYQGRHDEAISILESVISTHPNPPFWYYFAYGNALFNTGRYLDAVAPLEHCLMQSPTAPYCIRSQIANLAQLGRLDDAEWAIEEYAALGYEPTVTAIMKVFFDPDPETRAHLMTAFRKAGLPD